LGMQRHKIAPNSTAIKPRPVATFQLIRLKEVYPTPVSLDAREKISYLPISRTRSFPAGARSTL